MPSQRQPVVCMSYLAAAGLWKVSRFPKANHGAEVLAVERSVTADGPMAVATLTALDMPALLVANDLPGVVNGLDHADLAPLAAASFGYIDCYQLIEVPAVRVIHVARAAGVPLLLNLGASPLSIAVAAGCAR
jgi:hypothetical protein